MLNTNSTSAAQSLNIANVLLSAKWQKVADSEYGHIFTPEYFASGWDSIYVNPSDLKFENVSKGMRKLVAPTLLITSEKSQMAYVLASEDMPVYIQSEYTKDKNLGYIMAFAISPEVSPEYMFYACKFNLWERLLSNRIDADDYCPSWSNVGIFNYDPMTGISELTPEDLIRSLGVISIHTIARQKELIASAKEQDAVIEQKRYDVTELVNRYMMFTRQEGIFRQNGLGLLAKVYRIAAGSWAKPEVLNILKEYEFKKDILSQKELTFLSKHLNDVFTLVISSNGITHHPTDGFVQPQEVTDFMCKIASFPENVTVYNPFAGSNSYAIALPNHVVGEELNSTTWALGQIRLFANHAEQRTDITLGDSFTSIGSPEKFSAIITSPVFLIEEGHEISDIVNMLYDKLEDGGKLVCIVSAGFLFRKDRKVRTVRDRLIKDRAISSVIMLPSNIFTGTGVSQAALVITKGIPNEEILFADATGYTRFAKSVYRATTFDSDQFLKDLEDEVVNYFERGRTIDDTTIGASIDYSELIDSDLTPARYLTPKPSDGMALSEIASEVEELRGKDISAEYFLTGSSIPAAMHRKPFVPVKVEDGKVSTAKKHVQVPENAVILAIVSGNIRTVYTEGFTGKIVFPAGLIRVLKPINGISAKYLAAVLSTKIVADQIKAQTVGSIIPRLNKLDLRQIFIPHHSTVEEREQLIAEVLSSEMSDLESELQVTLDNQKREVRSTRHAMIQTLSALSSNWEQLKMFAELHDEGIKLSDTIGRINPISVKDLMGSIGYAMSTLQRQVESLRFEKPDWGKDTEINPYKFINDYIATHSSPSVRMVNIGNDNVVDFPYFADETREAKYEHSDAAEIFYAPVRLLERIFNNIVANAKAHGFTADSTNNEIRFDWKSEDSGIVITIANNGLPLKEGVSGDDVLMSGFTTALNEDASDGTLHSGQGGFEIKSLMEGLGTVEVISQPDEEFPVIYKLTFEKTNFETIDLFED